MDLHSQLPPTSPLLVASYVDGRDNSVPNTPVSPISPNHGFNITSKLDAYPHPATYTSPMVTSSNPVKPAKRKRLAKACDACHRSKRRCDGTLPCANCDFAGKSCAYTDPSGRAVAPPRTRSADPRPGQLDGWPYPIRYAYGADPDSSFQRATPVPTTSDPSPSSLNASLTRELVNLFFAHCHPATLIIHRSTFLHDLSRSQVPTYLLLAVFAVAAPYSLHPSIRTNRSWHAGDRFATEAANIVLADAEHTSDLSDSLDSLRIRPCLELAQTLVLLEIHDCVMRQSKSNRFVSLANDVLQAIGVMSMDQAPLVSTFDDHIRNESMRRTFWLIYQASLLSSAFTKQPIPPPAEHLGRLRLPVEEALFDLPRLETRPGMHPSYDYLPLPVGNKPCRSEFGNLIRVCRIYAGVVSATSQKAQLLQVWDPEQVTNIQMPSVSPLEVGLRRWLELLPDSLRLTEENLASQLSQLDGGAGAAAWAFTFMHALAETTVLALHEFADVGSEMKAPRTLSLREQKALENLTMILGAMGQRGRANMTMATFLVAIGRHLSPQDPQVASWFDEYFRMWGVSYDELMNDQFRLSWCTVRHMLSIPSGPFGDVGGSNQLGTEFDYDMDFGESGRPGRRLSSSDSSTEHSVAPSALTDGRGMVNGSSHISTSRFYRLRDDTQMMQDFSSSTGQPGGLTNGILPDMRLMRDEEASERLGALAVSAAVNATLRGSGASSRGPSRSTGAGDFIGDRLRREHLPTLVTNGLAGRGVIGLHNHDLYVQLPNGTGAGVSEEGGSQSGIDSPSLAQQSASFSVQPQARYGSRLSPHSVSPYTGQTVDDSELRVEGINWLADGTKMQ